MAKGAKHFFTPTPHPLTSIAPASENLLAGDHLLVQAFLKAPMHSAVRNQTIISAADREPPALLIGRGVAFSARTISDGRRAITDVLLPTDIVGVEHAVIGRSNRDIVAASPLAYRMLSANKLRQLMENPQVAAQMLALATATQWRADRLISALSRMDAYERIASFLLSTYDRLRRAQLVTRPTFALYLSQDQIGDHLGLTMVHVSRTLRRLREDKVVLVDRQVVIILDVERLRAVAAGLLPTTAAPREVEELSRFVDAAQGS
jgi:CRP-like cAMP-binding protein